MNAPYPNGSSPDSNHVFALLADYTDSLDSLPLDLTRSFSDLRELDAVLRSTESAHHPLTTSLSTNTTASINAITTKITTLTALLQDPTATPASRLFLLREIADAASHLKMGGEDKIRVAGIAAENLAAHQTHIHTVLKTISMVVPPAAHCSNGSDFDPTAHARRTTFPHVAPALEHVSAPSPQKRRRVGEGRPVNGNGAYGSSNGRAPPKRKPPVQARQPSPAESLRSFGATAGYSNHHGTNGFYENGYGHHNGRHHDDEDGTDDDAVATTNNHSSGSRSRKPPRRSNNAPVAANNSHGGTNPHEDASSLMDVVVAHPSDDEEHSFRPPEEPLYCTCKRVSFGEMIGCDNDDCPFEWFHLACVGITKPSPMEKWYCDRCREDAARKANAELSGNGNDATISTSTTNGAKPARGRGRGKGTGGVKRGRTVK